MTSDPQKDVSPADVRQAHAAIERRLDGVDQLVRQKALAMEAEVRSRSTSRKGKR